MDQPTPAWTRNSDRLNQELDWMAEVLGARKAAPDTPLEIEAPVSDPAATWYDAFIAEFELGEEDRLLVMLVMAPYLRPRLLELLAPEPGGAPRPELGGYFGQVSALILPTLNSALFLVAGMDLSRRLAWRERIRSAHPLFRQQWIRQEQLAAHEPDTASLLVPGTELVRWITTGERGYPEFGVDFPAELLATEREWEELVLAPATAVEVKEVMDWMEYESVVMDELGLRQKVSPGFKCLFYGPPGTGKTFTTSLLGKVTGRPVFRVDLSQVVSKYIGETEKNLRNVFDQAERKDWILFFDEADALFGKRTSVSDSKDRYANQEVSYLLQRIEQHDGVVVLATNHRDNLDKAFTRRFQLVIHFPMPNSAERYRLWNHAIPSGCVWGEAVDLNDLSGRYELSGGSITNVLRYCVLQAARRQSNVIEQVDLLEGVRREYRKVGRIVK